MEAPPVKSPPKGTPMENESSKTEEKVTKEAAVKESSIKEMPTKADDTPQDAMHFMMEQDRVVRLQAPPQYSNGAIHVILSVDKNDYQGKSTDS